MKRLLLIFLGAEFFPVLRYRPGFGFLLGVLASLSIKQWLFQYLPVTQAYGMLLQLSTGMCVLYMVLEVSPTYRGFLRTPGIGGWHSGGNILSCFGLVPLKTLLYHVEPLVAMLMASVAMLDIMHGYGPVFPWWRQLGIAPQASWINPWDYLPAGFWGQDAEVCAMLLPLGMWMGFAFHGKLCDWPGSRACRDAQRAQAEASAQASGQMVFSTVEEIRG